jgi:hypothetical protein
MSNGLKIQFHFSKIQNETCQIKHNSGDPHSEDMKYLSVNIGVIGERNAIFLCREERKVRVILNIMLRGKSNLHESKSWEEG